MNALRLRSFADIETAPPPWAMPLLIDCGSLAVRYRENVQVSNCVLDEILRLPTKAETAVSAVLQGWAETPSMAGWVAANECMAPSMLHSDAIARASVQTMFTVATVKAWNEKERASGTLLATAITGLVGRTSAPHYFGRCELAGSKGWLTSISGRSLVDCDVSKARSVLLFPDAGVLAGYDRYSVPNWDGDQAEPILPETVAATRSLLQVLPSNFGEPDIAPAADGTVGLEWMPDTGPLRKLFIDVGPKTVWRAYWKFANGNYGQAQGLTSDLGISETMKTLFRDLSD
jgi:hypothetical protein